MVVLLKPKLTRPSARRPKNSGAKLCRRREPTPLAGNCSREPASNTPRTSPDSSKARNSLQASRTRSFNRPPELSPSVWRFGILPHTESLWRFGTLLHTESLWRFGTFPMPEPAKCSTFSALFRRRNCSSLAGRKGDSPTSRPCGASRMASICTHGGLCLLRRY